MRRSSGSSTSTASCTTPRTTHRRCSRGPAGRTDNAEPAGASALAGALVTHAALTGSARHRDAASAALDACGPVAEQDPRFAGWALAVAEAVVAGPLQVAVVGEGAEASALAEVARASTSPGLVVVHGRAGCGGGAVAGGASARGRRARGLRLPRVRLRRTGHDA